MDDRPVSLRSIDISRALGYPWMASQSYEDAGEVPNLPTLINLMIFSTMKLTCTTSITRRILLKTSIALLGQASPGYKTCQVSG